MTVTTYQDHVPPTMTPTEGRGKVYLRFDTLARYFAGVKSCVCTAEIVDFDSVVSSIQDHYGLDDEEASDAEELIVQALDLAGMDDSEGGGLCSYCYHTLHKDD